IPADQIKHELQRRDDQQAPDARNPKHHLRESQDFLQSRLIWQRIMHQQAVRVKRIQPEHLPRLACETCLNRIDERAPSSRILARMPDSQRGKRNMRAKTMTMRGSQFPRRCLSYAVFALAVSGLAVNTASGQQAALRDPAEPEQGKPRPRLMPRPTGAMARTSVDEKSMRALIGKLVACGTRLTLSSWTDAKRGIGCGRDAIAARFNEIAKEFGGKLQVVVDKFESTSARTSDKA